MKIEKPKCNLISPLTLCGLCNAIPTCFLYLSWMNWKLRKKVTFSCDFNRIWRPIFAIFIEQYFYVCADNWISFGLYLRLCSVFLLHHLIHYSSLTTFNKFNGYCARIEDSTVSLNSFSWSNLLDWAVLSVSNVDIANPFRYIYRCDIPTEVEEDISRCSNYRKLCTIMFFFLLFLFSNE